MDAGVALLPQLHPELAALLPQLVGFTAPPAREVGLERARARFSSLLAAGLAGAPAVPADDVALADGLTGRVYRPADTRGGTVVFLHGGGWTVGRVADYDGLARRLAVRLPAVVLSVEYRRAPEHPFPAAVEDAVAATRWALAHAAELGGDPPRVAVAGDSGGGNLAAVVCQQLRDAGGPQPAAQLLLYPNVARGADQPSRAAPTWALHDSGREFAAGLGAAGGRAEWLDLRDMPHGFAHLVALSPAADAALDRVLDRAAVLLHGN
jgi:acetyl esterase